MKALALRLPRGLAPALSALLLGSALSGAPAASVRIVIRDLTQGPLASRPAFVTVTAAAPGGGFQRMDAQGAFHPCVAADNTVPAAGRTWCAYAIPLAKVNAFALERSLSLPGARAYISVGAPLLLRVDPATLGLVQPDPGNPTDPNAATLFDWVEFTLDGAGFHGNTTCVDQFALPITLEAGDEAGRTFGPVGLRASRAELFRRFRAGVPAPFRALADSRGLRITGPGHAASPALQAWFDGYVRKAWNTFRTRPLVLALPQGTFTGKVDAAGRMVFTRPGDNGAYLIRAAPSSLEVFRCDGVLAEGNPIERMLQAQVAALLNRHVLETPTSDPSRFYRAAPYNAYAAFWHAQGIDGKAYGFPYDDVDDQSTLLDVVDPQEIRITFRGD